RITPYNVFVFNFSLFNWGYMAATSIAIHDKTIELMAAHGLDITGLSPCKNDTRGSLCLTVESGTLMGRVTVALDGPLEAIQNLYSQCISHRRVILFEIV
ncbi:hypothetical protein, partial [Shewanella xiamenensis]|uniref:hypothetical protein n=1 Tax=Shewanella xiamenensis TaxID=332186 RepID=UPI0024A61082